MSIQAVAWALEQDIREPLKKLILISLANHASHITGECYPGLSLIAKEASCDRRTVIRRLPELEAAGFIAVRRSAGGMKQRNTYRLIMERSVCQTLRSDPQTLPPSVCQTPRGDSSVTRGGDTAVTTKDLHTTINKKPTQSRPTGPEVLQAEIARRLGHGDAATGWLLFGELSETQQDQLTAQLRNNLLSDDALSKARDTALSNARDAR